MVVSIKGSQGSTQLTKQCEDYLNIWKEWQRLPEEEPLHPKVRQAIEHIASCPGCMEGVSSITVDIAFEPTDEERKIGLVAFIEKARRDGIEEASRQYPAVASYLARNRYPFERAYALKRALSRGLENEKLPADVAHTIRSGIQPVDWAGLYAEKFGINRQGKLANQPKTAIEFHIDAAAGEVSFNTRLVASVALLPKTAQIQVKSALIAPPRGGPAHARRPRTATIYADAFNAQVLVDPQGRKVRVLLPDLPEYISQLPKVAIFPEDGTPRTKTARRTATGYEVLFADLESGNYMLAIDIMERARTPKLPKFPPIPKVPEKTDGKVESEFEEPRQNGEIG